MNMILLCIDDDPEDAAFFCDAVKTINAAVTCLVAGNGKEGMHILNKVRPDFVFLDINMPVMDGRETLETIRKDYRLRQIPVCILSTTANPNEIKMFRELGATACLTKPNTFNELCNVLRTMLHCEFK
jgi:CheY-like chemotaxis protein